MYRKSEEIKVRVEPLNKMALQEIANQEQLDLSDIVRKAIRDYLTVRALQSKKPDYGQR